MLGLFIRTVDRVTQAVAGNEIFSEEGKKLLRMLLKQIGKEIVALQTADSSLLSSSASSSSSVISEVSAVEEQQEALKILLKVKSLLGKLSSLNSWGLIALGALEPATVDPNKPIAALTLEDLVQDLLLNRDIYWEVKNKFLHQSLGSLFDRLAALEERHFSAAGLGILRVIGGMEKIKTIGNILSSLLPFYAITQVHGGISKLPYSFLPGQDLLENFRGTLTVLHNEFLLKVAKAKAREEIRWLANYQQTYQIEVTRFLNIVTFFPGEIIFLETHPSLEKDSILSFRPQREILSRLLEIEFSLNKDLVEKFPDFRENKPPLGAVYNYIVGQIEQDAVHARRQALFSMVTEVIIRPFQEYIDINKNNDDLAKEKAHLLQQFLDKVIYRPELLFNDDGKPRTADNHGEGVLYPCAEIARVLLVELIAVVKVHDQKCRAADRSIGRTGSLLAGAIKATAEYLQLPYDRRLDDTCLSALSAYEDELPQFFPKLTGASSHSGVPAAADKEKETEFTEVSLAQPFSRISFRA